ncbi:MAG: hypothetical protein HC919_14930 [Oscillatoriales cyanobacterium SM2_2_1]|nr:hypothetical protein [Oscillatoriales cyanobacterium SM2_2_1]
MAKIPELRHYLLDLEQLECSIPAADFDPDRLESLADNLLVCGDAIKPIVVKMVGIEKYQVIAGFLEYHAALCAQRKNPKFEKIGGYIVDSKNEELVRSQLSLLGSENSPPPAHPPEPEPPATDLGQSWFERLDQQISLLSQILQQQSQSMMALHNGLLKEAIAQAVKTESSKYVPLSADAIKKLISEELRGHVPGDKPEKKYTQEKLEIMPIKDLKEVAKGLGVANYSKIKIDNRNEYIGKIMAKQDSE